MINEKAFQEAMFAYRNEENAAKAVMAAIEAYEAAKLPEPELQEDEVERVATAIFQATRYLIGATVSEFERIAARAAIACIKPTLDKSAGIKQNEDYLMEIKQQIREIVWRDRTVSETTDDIMAALLPHLSSPKPVSGWQPIETAPKDEPVILANFTAQCLLSGAPHVWTARLASKDSWIDGNGNKVSEDEDMWLECSYAATNENGEATHWMPLPSFPKIGAE